jgi:uncharacterized membrane protein
MNRQKIVGWVLIGASIVYIVYLLKARIFAAGPALTTKEWVYFVLSFVGVMLGTINIRMAEMRERNQKIASFIADPNQPPKK